MILRPPPKPAEKSPPTVFSQEVLSRLPLAQSFYALWSSVASNEVLAELFAMHRGRCYEDQLTFVELVRVLVDALTRFKGSGNQAIRDALERQQLSTKGRTVYDKLKRLPLPLAEAFLATLTARLRPLFPPRLCRTQLPDCVAGLNVVVLDGKKIKKAAKRLLATRGRPGKLFGGKILCAYLPADGLVVALAADPDGEANDIRLMPRFMPLTRAAVPAARLWVADAQFCDLDQPALFTEDEGDHFLLRFTARNSFTVDSDPQRAARSGTNRQGQEYTQDWGWMGSAKDPRRRYLRRIVVKRSDGEDVVVVTDLLDATAFSAEDLLEIYLHRWQIENVFQQITEVFDLQHLIGNAPGATVFQASLCLVIYNMLQVIRGYVAAGPAAPRPCAELSVEKIFESLKKQLVSLHEVLDTEVLRCLPEQPPSVEEIRALLAACVDKAWTPQWIKAVNKKPRRHKPKPKQSGAHTSVHKILQEAKQKKNGKVQRSQVPK